MNAAWRVAFVTAVLALAGCSAPGSAKVDPDCPQVSLRALFVYDGVRCGICHKAVRPQDGRVWVVDAGSAVFYAHEGCAEFPRE